MKIEDEDDENYPYDDGLDLLDFLAFDDETIEYSNEDNEEKFYAEEEEFFDQELHSGISFSVLILNVKEDIESIRRQFL
jgi:hypothetical protein